MILTMTLLIHPMIPMHILTPSMRTVMATSHMMMMTMMVMSHQMMTQMTDCQMLRRTLKIQVSPYNRSLAYPTLLSVSW